MADPVHLDLEDPDRRRGVPVSLYLPDHPEPPWSLVVFSPGFGGHRDDYRLLASSWARAGFAVAVLEHPGSGPEALARLNRVPRERRTAALLEFVRDPEEMAHRPRDVSFALDRLEEVPGLSTRAVGIGGHSYGAYTALAAGGVPVSFSDGTRKQFRDPRAAAVLALSPPLPGLFFAQEDHGLEELPLMMVTGTRDYGPFLDSAREDRTKAFDPRGPAPRYLAVFEGADHMAFAEKGLRYKPFLQPVQALTTSFWDAFLRGGAPPQEVPLLARWEAAASP